MPRQRRPSSRRPSASASAAAEPSLTPAFASLLRGARGLQADPDPLQAEAFASSVIATFPHSLIDIDDPEAFFGGRLVDYLIAKRTNDALAVLHGLASVTSSETLGRLAHAGALRLRVAGRTDPPWVHAVGRSRFVEAFAPVDPYEEQDLVVATFAYPDGSHHALVFLADQNFDGLIRQAHLAADPDEVRQGLVDSGEFAVRPIGAQGVADKLAQGLRVFDESIDPPCDEDMVQLVPLLRARQRALPAPLAMEPRPFSEHERDAILNEFSRSEEAGRSTAAIDLADLFVTCRLDRLDADPVRWSPIAVEMCLLDWLPRKAMLDPAAVGTVPEALKRWVRFSGRKKGLAADAIEETLAAVDRFAPDFRAMAADPSRRGPARTLIEAMLGDGIDVGDQGSVETWIEAFNARPIEERGVVMGWASRPPALTGSTPPSAPNERTDDHVRRAFAAPPGKGLLGGIDLALLDPSDPDDRSILVEFEHPEFARALKRGQEVRMNGQPVNPRLHLALHEIIVSQLWDDQPPATWVAAQRLIDQGLGRHDIMHRLMRAVSDIVYAAMSDPFQDRTDQMQRALEAVGTDGPSRRSRGRRSGSK